MDFDRSIIIGRQLDDLQNNPLHHTIPHPQQHVKITNKN